jgi:hypothetical protein
VSEWRSSGRQAAFLKSTEDEVLYGGAAGGGKTDALLISCARTAVKHAGSQSLFLRRTFADLNKPQAAIPRSHKLFSGSARWDGQQHRWIFPNRSVIQFGHLQHAKNIYSYQGSQIDWLCWDELTHFTEDEYNYLRSRVRATVPGIKTGIRAATNPGGIGHAWVRKRWVDAGPADTPFVIEEAGRTVMARFVPARVWDNAALLERDPEYPTRLATLGDALSRALLEGDWDTFQGQVFTQWRREKHVVRPSDVTLDPTWPRWTCTDYGLARPFVTLWLCQDPATLRIYVYREISKPGVLASEQAQMIVAAERRGGDRIRFRVGDPAMWIRQADTGKAISSTYQQNGVAMQPASNERIIGWERVHEFLRDAPDGKPYLQVFDTCTELIKNLPALVYDQHVVEDVDTDGPDDEADALRYGLMAAHWISATRRREPQGYTVGGRR